MQKYNNTPKRKMQGAVSYQDRLRGYEQDKQRLISITPSLPYADFEERIKALRDRWRI